MDDYGNGIPVREEPQNGADNGRLTALMAIVPACAFALYSLLLFLLFLAPVEKVSGFGGSASQNVYQMTELGICTALIVFAAFSLASSLFGLLLLPRPFPDLGKKSPLLATLGKVWQLLPLFFYFLLYSLSCALTGATSIAASALGASSVAPPLILSFTIVFALVHIACLLLPKFKK